MITTKQMLNEVAKTVKAITPGVGGVFVTLKARITDSEVETDFQTKIEESGKNILKGWTIRPSTGNEGRSTVSQAFSEGFQNIELHGMVTIDEGQATEDIIEGDMFRIRDALRKRPARLINDKNAFITGEMSWTSLGIAKFGQNNVYTKTLTVQIQDRLEGK